MHASRINLPKAAEAALKKSPDLDAIIRTALFNTASFIASNRLEFFPEYTDHDTSHIEAVIDTCYDLITPESLEIITSNDHALIILSAILHDLGMHITVDGFYTLISEPAWLKRIERIDGDSWGNLWDSYLQSARRFDERQLISLFGENFRPVSDIPKQGNPLDEFDRLLVVDFLRGHHIALYGIPVRDGNRIPILPECLTSAPTGQI